MTMKKLIASLIAALALVAVIAPTTPAAAQVLYCSSCCGMINGNPVVGCGLQSPAPCGNPCWCPNVPGQGFCC